MTGPHSYDGPPLQVHWSDGYEHGGMFAHRYTETGSEFPVGTPLQTRWSQDLHGSDTHVAFEIADGYTCVIGQGYVGILQPGFSYSERPGDFYPLGETPFTLRVGETVNIPLASGQVLPVEVRNLFVEDYWGISGNTIYLGFDEMTGPNPFVAFNTELSRNGLGKFADGQRDNLGGKAARAHDEITGLARFAGSPAFDPSFSPSTGFSAGR